MNKQSLVAGMIIAAALAAPFAASALSFDDLQQQVNNLLARVATLQAQMTLQGGSSSLAMTAPSTIPSTRVCAVITRNLSRGQRGNDVRDLQELLVSEGYLHASATGYFGAATVSALTKWQVSEGVSGSGSVGVLTRERIKIRCGNQYGFSVTPLAGAAPLTVTAFANVGGFINYTYTIDFGDGTSGSDVRCSAFADVCRTPGSVSHTYTQAGTYTVVLFQNGGANNEHTAIAKDSVHAGDGGTTTSGTLSADPAHGAAPLPVTFTYQPTAEQSGQYWIEFGDGNGQNMDTHQIYCFRAPCISPVVSSHTYTTAGTYDVYVEQYIGCQHTTPRCMIATRPLAHITVTVTGTNTTGTPAISGFSGPTSLSVNQTGTWSITASDPENGSLNYSILWGDETQRAGNMSALAQSASVQQNTTFTHSYAQAGSYTVSVTVTNAAGVSAKTTGTVQVGQGVCTADYAPVCGRPAGCTNICAAGQMCPAICQIPSPATYSNRCAMNNAQATYMHDGVCTGNEGYLQ